MTSMSNLFNTVIFHEIKTDVILTDEERQELNDLHFKYLASKENDVIRFSLTYKDIKLLDTLYVKSIQANRKRVLMYPQNNKLRKRVMRYQHNYQHIKRIRLDMEKMAKVLNLE